MIKIVIPVAPRTKKNSSRIVRTKSGRYAVLPSSAYVKYEKQCGRYLPHIEPIDGPVNIKAIYYMDTRRRVDLVNLHEALCDMLVHYKIIADDNFHVVARMDGSYVDYDKDNPRTEIIITDLSEDDLK